MRALLLVAMVVLVPMAWGADEPEPGKLDAKLVVKDVQGGFAGFTGKSWTVNADGAWTESTEGRGGGKIVAKGTIKGKKLAALAAALKKYGAATLKDTGKPMANPRVVTITFGDSKAVLNLPTTAELPKPDEKDLAGRFAGVVGALKDALPKAGKKPDEK